MSSGFSRRSILRHIGISLSAGIAGCNALSGENGLDVEMQNEHSQSHTISVAIDDFKETVTLDPDTSETFSDVLPYPDSPTEKEVVVQLDDDWEDTHTFSLVEEMKAFIVNVSSEGEVSYTFKGR